MTKLLNKNNNNFKRRIFQGHISSKNNTKFHNTTLLMAKSSWTGMQN